MEKKDLLFNYCLRLGDTALILGQRLSELCSKGPFIEEDLAITNISLDLYGRAQAIFKYAGEVEEKKRDEDDIAYLREERNYHNYLITEQPNGDFANVISRQLYLSAFELLFYSELEKSNDVTLAGIASKTIKEIKYHLQHVSDWTIRLGDGTSESKRRMQNAINDLWMYTDELFEMDDIDLALSEMGIGVNTTVLKSKWTHYINEIFNEAKLTMPSQSNMQTGSKRGIHTEHLGHLLSEMQYLQRTYPGAKW